MLLAGALPCASAGLCRLERCLSEPALRCARITRTGSVDLCRGCQYAARARRSRLPSVPRPRAAVTESAAARRSLSRSLLAVADMPGRPGLPRSDHRTMRAGRLCFESGQTPGIEVDCCSCLLSSFAVVAGPYGGAEGRICCLGCRFQGSPTREPGALKAGGMSADIALTGGRSLLGRPASRMRDVRILPWPPVLRGRR